MKSLSLRVMLALASIGAAVIHFVVTPEHLHEYVLFGVFFLLLGVFQTAWASAALLKPNALVLVIGVVASALVIAIWAVSRTAGLPFGPQAGEPESIGVPDALATGLEGLIAVAGTFALVRRADTQRPAQVVPAEQERRAA